jgi:hypothetical protein
MPGVGEEEIEIGPNWNEEDLMKRLNRIISPHDYGLFKKDTGYGWQLDSSNDYWAQIRDGKLVLAYRYGPTNRFLAFVQFVKEWLGVRT